MVELADKNIKKKNGYYVFKKLEETNENFKTKDLKWISRIKITMSGMKNILAGIRSTLDFAGKITSGLKSHSNWN